MIVVAARVGVAKAVVAAAAVAAPAVATVGVSAQKDPQCLSKLWSHTVSWFAFSLANVWHLLPPKLPPKLALLLPPKLALC